MVFDTEANMMAFANAAGLSLCVHVVLLTLCLCLCVCLTARRGERGVNAVSLDGGQVSADGVQQRTAAPVDPEVVFAGVPKSVRLLRLGEQIRQAKAYDELRTNYDEARRRCDEAHAATAEYVILCP